MERAAARSTGSGAGQYGAAAAAKGPEGPRRVGRRPRLLVASGTKAHKQIWIEELAQRCRSC